MPHVAYLSARDPVGDDNLTECTGEGGSGDKVTYGLPWPYLMLRALIFLITAWFIPAWSIAEAQSSSKVSRIGWLSAVPESTSSLGQNQIIGFLQGFGYVQGKNIEYEFRNADNRLDRLPALADELVKRKMDVLITPGTASALALRNATKTIPIIFTDVTDPIGAGLVESLAKPGGNVTGFTSIESVLTSKRLELLNETIPNFASGCPLGPGE
jgi:putative ABC transport system substrate-binding protein